MVTTRRGRRRCEQQNVENKSKILMAKDNKVAIKSLDVILQQQPMGFTRQSTSGVIGAAATSSEYNNFHGERCPSDIQHNPRVAPIYPQEDPNERPGLQHPNRPDYGPPHLPRQATTCIVALYGHMAVAAFTTFRNYLPSDNPFMYLVSYPAVIHPQPTATAILR